MNHDHYLSWYFIPTLLIINYNLLLVSKVFTYLWLLILCTGSTKCWGWGETAILIHCCEKVKWWCHFVRQLAVFYKTKHPLTIWSRNCIPWYLPKGVKTDFHTKPHTCKFTIAFFLTAKTWKQPRYSSVGEWINTL